MTPPDVRRISGLTITFERDGPRVRTDGVGVPLWCDAAEFRRAFDDADTDWTAHGASTLSEGYSLVAPAEEDGPEPTP